MNVKKTTAVVWAITNQCNMQCRHCYVSPGKYADLSAEGCMDIIAQMREAGITSVVLTGGEPLSREDFWDIVDALLSSGIEIAQLKTNGLLAGASFMEACRSRNINPLLGVSFDGVGWHDWLRRVQGAEERTLQTIGRLLSGGFRVTAQTTLHRFNIDSLYGTMNRLVELGVRKWMTGAALDIGNWSAQGSGSKLSVSELCEAYLRFIPLYVEAGFPMDVSLAGFFIGNKKTRAYDAVPVYNSHIGMAEGETALSQPLCHCARSMPYIHSDGTLWTCAALLELGTAFTPPDLTKQRLREALHDPEFTKLADLCVKDLFDHNPSCNACVHKLDCKGGCRAAALSAGGGFWGADEVICHMFKKGYRERIDQAVNNVLS